MKQKESIEKRAKREYKKGNNVMEFFRKLTGKKRNATEAIRISYDLQAGSYIDLAKKNKKFVKTYTRSIARIIDKYKPMSILEIGVGEATTLGNVIIELKTKPTVIKGFDISNKRIVCARRYLDNLKVSGVDLFVSDLFNIPLNDNSIDVVYTFHSLEPNGGKEREAIKEALRVAKKYLILFEPSWEFANKEDKKRMENHGYVTKLYRTVRKMRLNVVSYYPFKHSANPLNPTGVIVIKKRGLLFREK